MASGFRFHWLAGLLLLPTVVAAHGDVEKPVYVADGGKDQGNCKDPAAPCGSIDYALSQTGKGGEIRLAAGRFRIGHAENLFLLASGTVAISGGYDPARQFRPSAGGLTTITGVPLQYRDAFPGSGLQVLADTKGDATAFAREAQKMLAQHAALQLSMSSAPCNSGTVNGLPCDAVDLLSHVAFGDVTGNPSRAADVWGFVDLNTRREYAIVGYNNGTGVFDVTDAASPMQIGYINGQNTTWRDIKVYQYFDALDARWNAYAYVTTDGASDGLFVIDLTHLPHAISRSPFVSDFAQAHNVYASSIDYATGVSLGDLPPVLIIAGSNLGSGNARGRYRAYDLADPESPEFSGQASNGRYMHDASSMLITDTRKDTQCVNATAACRVLFDFNENELEIWDVTDTGNGVRLGSTSYANAAYVHSGWWTEDKQYVLVHDELDEQQRGLPTTVRVISVANLANPSLAATWSGPTAAIDHNGFARGNRYYMSNYSRGLTVLDIGNPLAPVEAGFLDTYPVSDSSGFVGAWGAYPFFHSGSIAISDINSGLYMAVDRSLDVPQGRFSFDATSYSLTEGTQVSIGVRRSGGSSGAVGVAYELIAANAAASDFAVQSGTLAWGPGETATHFISVDAIDDGAIEDLELVLLRLVAPTGGATLGANNSASLYIGDAGRVPEIDFLERTIDTAEVGMARAFVTLRRHGSAAGAVSVNVSMTAGNAVANSDFQGDTSAQLSWADGDGNPKTLEYLMVDDGVDEDMEFFELTLGNAVGAAIGSNDVVRINIGNGTGINNVPNAFAGNSQMVAAGSTVTLDGSQSRDLDGDALTFQWTQTLGPAVSIDEPLAMSTTFIAPDVSSDMVLQFRLTVADPSGQSDASTVTVTVVDGSSVSNGNSSGGGAWDLPLCLVLLSLLWWRPIVAAVSRTGAA